MEVEGFTNNLSVRLIFKASDLTAWRAAINNESTDFPANPSFSDYTSSDSVTKLWSLAPSGNLASVFARFEDKLNHTDSDFIPSASIIYDDVPPDENATILINSGDLEAESEIVTLSLSNNDLNIFQMNISNSIIFLDDAWMSFNPSVQNWSLDAPNGYDKRAIFVKFRDKAGNTSTSTVKDSIILNPVPAAPLGFSIDTVYNSTIGIKWEDSIENDFQKYIVYREEGIIPADSIGETTFNFFVDTGLINGAEYRYYISAVDNTDKQSDPTSKISGTPVNAPPEIVVQISPAAGTQQTQFTFNASSTEDDVTILDSLEFRWDFDNDGSWDNSFSAQNVTVDSVTFSQVGDRTIVIEVRDNDPNQRMSISEELSIHINIPPSNPNIVAPVGPHYRNTNHTFTASGTDSDSNPSVLSYRWIVSGDTLAWGEPGINTKTIQSDTLGSIGAKVQIKDEWDETSAWSNTSTIQILNKVPNAGFTISPSSVGSRETSFTLCATTDLASDGDDITPFNELLFEWKTRASDEWSTATTSPCTIISYANDQEFIFDVSLRVTDGDGGTGTASDQIRINRKPDRPELSLAAGSTLNPIKNDPVSFVGSSSDPDNDPLEFYFNFGDGDNSGWGTPTVSHPYVSSGSYNVTVKARDTWGDESLESPPLNLNVQNAVPSPPVNPTLNPTPTYKNSSITVSATLADQDGDNVQLRAQWGDGTSDIGGFVAEGSRGSATKSSRYSSSGNKSVILTTKDIEGEESSTLVFSISITNRAPGTPELSGFPTSGFSGDQVSFSARSIDPDEDDVRITVIWGDGDSDSSPFVSSGQWTGFSHTYNSTGTKNLSISAEDIEGLKSGSIGKSIPISQRPPAINNPTSLSIVYPTSSDQTIVENTAPSGSQTLLISSVNDDATWLSTSISDASLTPGQTATLTATVTSWSSFGVGQIKNATITISTNAGSKNVAVSAHNNRSTIRVTFHGFDVNDDAEFGPGQFYWMFKVDDAPTLTETVDEVPASDEVHMEFNAPPPFWYEVNKYVEFTKTNVSGESFKVWFRFWEDDAIFDDYLGEGGRSTHSYPWDDDDVYYDEQLLTAPNGTQVKVVWSISITN